MNKKDIFRVLPAASAVPVLVLVGLMAGCGGDQEIKTYRVAKDESPSHEGHAHASADASATPPSIPHLHSSVPEGWQELKPEKMRVASYRIPGKDGKFAEVAVIPLPGVGKIELQSVNMWREELELGPVTAEQLKENSHEVTVGDVKGILVDLSAGEKTSANKASTGILGAVAARGDITWFIKAAGDKGLLAEQKENFVGFLKSLEFHEEAHGGQPTQLAQAVPSVEKPVSTNTEKLPEGSEKPNFKPPETWKPKPPGPMITSAYNVQAEGGQAEVTISKFPGPVGGMVPNIQRWYGQLGQKDLSPEEAKKAAEMIEIGGKKEAYLVDLKGTNARTGKAARMVAVGVPYQGDTWFFKLLGDEAVVAKEKDNFIKFVTSAY